MLPPPPVLAPPTGAAELVAVAVSVTTGAGGAEVDKLGVGEGGGGGLDGRTGGGVGVGVGFWQVHVGDGVGEGGGVGCWQVHVGVGVGVGFWQVHVGDGDGAGAVAPTLVWAADRVVACAAVPVSMNAATPKAKQPASTRIRIAISRSSSLDRSLTVMSDN